jgi:hypothetical protein
MNMALHRAPFNNVSGSTYYYVTFQKPDAIVAHNFHHSVRYYTYSPVDGRGVFISAVEAAANVCTPLL